VAIVAVEITAVVIANSTCHKCGKVGHTAPVYRTKPNKSTRGGINNTKWVAVSEQNHPPDSQEEPIFVVRNRTL